MAPLYETLVASKVLKLDQSALDSMRAKNDDELKKLEEKWVVRFDLVWIALCHLCDWFMGFFITTLATQKSEVLFFSSIILRLVDQVIFSLLYGIPMLLVNSK